MEEYITTSDFFKVFETVRIPLVITDSALALVYANPFAREVLPLKLEKGMRLEIDSFLQHEDSIAFERMVTECVHRGESLGTLKQKGFDKYYKVKAYFLKNRGTEIVFHFEDVSQSRILENQLYEHLVDLYSQLETQEREIADLKAIILRSKEY
jgi:nitrogen-specific signal transduction histidine kinase